MNQFLKISYEGDLSSQTLAVKRAMRHQWEKYAENIYIVGLVAGFAVLFAGLMAFIGADKQYISYSIAGIGIALSGVLARKSNKYSYYLLFVSVAVFLMGYTVIPGGMSVLLPAFAGTVLSIADVILNIKALKYFDTYTALTNEPGFPEFTLASETRALELIKQKQFEKEWKVPLNAVENQEQPIKITEKDIARKEYEQKVKKGSTSYNKFRYPGRFFIYTDDIAETTFQDKKKMMAYWTMYVNYACRLLKAYIFVQIATTMFSMMDGGPQILYIIFPVINIYTLSAIHASQKKGYAVFFLSYALSVAMFPVVGSQAFSISDTVAPIMLLLNLAAGIIPIVAILHCVLNLKLYNALSKEDGFPSFVKTTADLYGDQMYIVEKSEPVKTENDDGYFINRKDKVVFMNVGYDDKEDKDNEEKAWNAFDYRDGDDNGEIAEDISNSVFTGDVIENNESGDSNEEADNSD